MKSSLVALSLAAAVSASPLAERASWSGWKNVKHLFVFGDSYTQTGFDPKSTQPSPANPFGNPTWPGWTSSNGPNWISFLTETYNASLLLTYNLAYGGATVDSALVTPYQPTVLSLKNQVQDEFLPIYGNGSTSAVKWSGADSLFAFWIGINDVGNSWWLSNATDLYTQIFGVYGGLLDQVYASGARNFLFLQVPPVNKAPLTLANGDYAIENEGNMIGVWNQKVADMVSAFSKKHSGVKTWVHGTNALFDNVIANPAKYPQTSGLKNVTGYCSAYENGTPTWYTKDASCQYAVNEYLWLNSLHPTFPVHNATAASLVQLLGGKK